MASQIDHIKELSEFISNLEVKNIEGRDLTGKAPLDQSIFESLTKFEKNFNVEIEFNGKKGAVAKLKRALERNLCGSVNFKIQLPRSSKMIYAKNLDDVIQYHNFAWEKPEILLIDSLKYRSFDGGTPPDLVRAYYIVVDLINLFTDEKAGNYFTDNHKGFFIHFLGPDKKLQLDIAYSANDLNFNALNKSMSDLSSIFAEKAYLDTKYTLLRTTLIELLKPIPQAKRFKYLLNNITEAITQFKQNYELFLSEFKFEDEKEKIEQAKREYMLSLNKVFDDIQNKILTIPVSLILIGSQMKFPDKIDTKSFISNTIILLGSFMFSWIMILMTRNQKHTLNAIKRDYEVREKRIKYQLRDSQLYNELSGAFKDIKDRYGNQKRRLLIINCFVFLGFIVTIYLYQKTISFSYLLLKWYEFFGCANG